MKTLPPELLPVIQITVPLMVTIFLVTAVAAWSQNKRIDDVHAGLNGLRADLNAAVNGLRGELNAGLNGLRGELNGLRGELNGLRGELNAGLNGLRGELNGLREELKDLRGDVTTLRNDMNRQFDQIHATLANHGERLAHLEERIPPLIRR